MAQEIPFFGGSSGDPVADRRYDFGLQFAARGDHAAAADLFQQALDLAPNWPPLRFHYAEALRLCGQNDAARQAFGRYLQIDPADHMGAAVKLALIDQVTPRALPASYVQSLFDQYAERFDTALVDHLDYRTPDYMADLILQAAPGRRFARAIDLGCGTGLAMAPLRLMVDDAEGIDLSPAMIEQARKKNLYDLLLVSDIEEYLIGSNETYDLMIAGDVFVYLGDLNPLFMTMARALKPGGLVCFSTQHYDGSGYRLGEDHRYAHASDYIKACLDKAGLGMRDRRDVALRKDGGKPVAGTIWLAGKN